MSVTQANRSGALPQHPVLQWSGRWGPTRTEGEADFIPVQGGCVLSVGLSGVGPVSKLLLSDVSPVSKLLWRSIERFSAFPERS
jgi:hypothetical protein